MRRREFVAALSIAAMLPRATGAQTNTPVIGTIHPSEKGEGSARNLAGYSRGLAELGYAEGQNFRFETKYAHFQYDRFPILLHELLDQKVTLIMLSSTAQLAVAKQVIQSIPLVFTIGSDPVENGFVESLNKPGGNITGVFTLNVVLAGKRLQMLRELVPSVAKFAFLTNPSSPKFSEAESRDIRAAAESLGVNLVAVNARNSDEFEGAFEAAVREGAGGLVVGSESIFIANPRPLLMLAARYRLPSIYGDDKPAQEGGLISYGADQDEAYRLMGIYAGQILKGEKPRNMPVQQSTKTKLVINLKTAKDLGITISTPLLGRADEVIE
jgi:putative tryptophan/tyrosine transport system substrate-binding protein